MKGSLKEVRMKRIHDTNRIAELFVKAGLIAAIAGALLVPASINATGAEAAHDRHAAFAPTPGTSNPLTLPPIAHLDTMLWLDLDRSRKKLRIDTLLVPGIPQNFFAGSGSHAPTGLSTGPTKMASTAATNG
jgi:hypothetical protein